MRGSVSQVKGRRSSMTVFFDSSELHYVMAFEPVLGSSLITTRLEWQLRLVFSFQTLMVQVELAGLDGRLKLIGFKGTFPNFMSGAKT